MISKFWNWIVGTKKHNCKNCRFSKGSKYDLCWVGTYYAEQGKKAICFEGELWESDNNLKTK